MKKHKHGGAYIMVLIATMAIFLMLYVVLTVTATSRQLTSRYEHFANLYDLAVAGNEHALRMLNQYIFANRDEILYELGEYHPYREEIIAAATPFLQRAATANQTRYWTITVNYLPNRGAPIHDHYRAVTRIEPIIGHPDRFITRTEIRKYIGIIPWPGTTVVEARIYWCESINLLDDSMLTMVELMRIAT